MITCSEGTNLVEDTAIAERIMQGDLSVFKEASRWMIVMLYRNGHLKGAPDSVKGEIQNVLDDCKTSN